MLKEQRIGLTPTLSQRTIHKGKGKNSQRENFYNSSIFLYKRYGRIFIAKPLKLFTIKNIKKILKILQVG